ncbi:toxin glutamine deamidase domain-containing protein [Pectobacterium aroidearum]|uniref:toxin glutamine deamidase domain-containing protein n=1 Tax=Pectobacterium aroidearum TaxID=1201031 RepID=UPI0038998EF9
MRSPRWPKDGISLTVLEKHYNSSFRFISGSDAIAQRMLSAGNGARGIIYGSCRANQPDHVFNVINQNGIVRFLDGQAGKSANLSQFKSYYILRTNK